MYSLSMENLLTQGSFVLPSWWVLEEVCSKIPYVSAGQISSDLQNPLFQQQSVLSTVFLRWMSCFTGWVVIRQSSKTLHLSVLEKNEESCKFLTGCLSLSCENSCWEYLMEVTDSPPLFCLFSPEIAWAGHCIISCGLIKWKSVMSKNPTLPSII